MTSTPGRDGADPGAEAGEGPADDAAGAAHAATRTGGPRLARRGLPRRVSPVRPCGEGRRTRGSHQRGRSRMALRANGAGVEVGGASRVARPAPLVRVEPGGEGGRSAVHRRVPRAPDGSPAPPLPAPVPAPATGSVVPSVRSVKAIPPDRHATGGAVVGWHRWADYREGQNGPMFNDLFPARENIVPSPDRPAEVKRGNFRGCPDALAAVRRPRP